MRRLLRHSLLFLGLPLLLAAQQQKPQLKTTNLQGTLEQENTYSNPTLGMIIVLPSKWQIIDEPTRKLIGEGSSSETHDQNCNGALCDLQIVVSLITKAGHAPPGRLPNDDIALIAYKVPPRYLDRERYPLKAFAKLLTIDNAQSSDWTIDGDLAPIQIDGKPAYRLYVHIFDRIVKKRGYMYVGEANGYIFLIVAITTSYMMDPDSGERLQAATEAMKLKDAR